MLFWICAVTSPRLVKIHLTAALLYVKFVKPRVVALMNAELCMHVYVCQLSHRAAHRHIGCRLLLMRVGYMERQQLVLKGGLEGRWVGPFQQDLL